MSDPIESSDIAQKSTIKDKVRWFFQDIQHHFVTEWHNGCDWLKWLGHKESNGKRHARHELELAGWFDDDGMYGNMMGHAVMRLQREFSHEGHSGMSASVATQLFAKISRFEPLTPLTGKDDEWNECSEFDGKVKFQNKHASNVFKDANGRAYDINGKVFREPDGCSYTSSDSVVDVTFPYTPKVMYVDVPKDSG